MDFNYVGDWFSVVVFDVVEYGGFEGCLFFEFVLIFDDFQGEGFGRFVVEDLIDLAEAALAIEGEDFVLVTDMVFGETKEIAILGMGMFLWFIVVNLWWWVLGILICNRWVLTIHFCWDCRVAQISLRGVEICSWRIYCFW